MINKIFRIIRFTFKSYLSELKEKIAFDRFINDWKQKNSHNNTVPIIMFPISKVNVGTGTYGPLDVRTFSDSNEQLKIGNYCSIAKDVIFVLGGMHRSDCLSTFPWKSQFKLGNDDFTKGSIILEDDVWIGTGAVILSNVHIGKGAIIGACSVISKDVPPYAIVVGNPQKIVKYRFSEEIIRLLINLDFGIIDENYINDHLSELYTFIDRPQIIEDLFTSLLFNDNK